MNRIEYIDRKSGEIVQEVVPGEGWLRWLYHTPLGKLALHAVIKRKLVSDWYGRKMDQPDSVSRIPEFVADLKIDMGEAERSIEEFISFNDFFIRTLKPEARPVDQSDDTIVSPADGKVLAFDGICGLDSFFVKGQAFNLDSFLDNGLLSKKFSGGTLMIIRLAPADYHRFHFPASGRISESTFINGDYYSVSPYAVKKRMSVYWENKREYSVLHSHNVGDILLCEVGATMVGSIVQNYIPEGEVHKGDEKGFFKFGGSTVVMLFEKGKVRVDSDIISNTQKGYETSIKIGERVAASCV